MAQYKDSVGNVYERLPKAPPQHTAKSSSSSFVPRRSWKHRKNGATIPTSKYAKYRSRVGRPNGPAKPGNKAGKNKI